MKVYLADDHTILRQGLKLILAESDDMEIIGESGDGREALEEIERLHPDLAILDISLPSTTGIEIARQIHKYHPEIKVIILSRHDNPEYVQELLRFGISGYVLKDEAGDDLLRAIEAAKSGETYLSPRITKDLLSEMQGSPKRDKEAESFSYPQLSHREKEISKLLAEGHSNEEVAKALWISPSTVKVHRQNIMKKLNIHKMADLVKYAIKTGLIEP